MATWIDTVKEHLPFAAKALETVGDAIDEREAPKVALGLHVLAAVVNGLAEKSPIDPELVKSALDELMKSMKGNDQRADSDLDAKFKG